MSQTAVTDPEIIHDRVEKIRADALFDGGDVVLGPFSEQHYLAALACLEQAKAHLRLCSIFIMRKE